MAFCSFGEGAAIFDATPIENMFLIEYMYDAPAPALRVYLYARMLALHPELGGGVADMAKALRMDEDEVCEAFAYWERRELVRRLTDQPPTYAMLSLRGQGAAGASSLDREMYENRDFNNSLQRLFNEKLIERHEQMKAVDWLNILHFDKDAVLRLVEYGISTSRSKDPKPASVFKRMDRVAEAWAQRGVRTLEDVERAIAEETGDAQIAREALKKLGISRQPTEPELTAVRRWTRDWGYDREAILAACDKTISARNPTVKYLDSILEAGLSERPEVRPALAEVLRELSPGSAQPSPDDVKRYQALLDAGFSQELIKLAAVQCHRQRQYKFDDLEWRLSDWREEGLRTPEEADAYMKALAVCKRQLRAVLKRAGSDRSPSREEIKTYRAWRDAYPAALIDYAAECSRHTGGSMAYMETLLTAWQKDGIATVEAARAQHESRRASSGQPGGASANPALDYQQREYREEDYGDDFFEDLSKYAEGGGKA